MGPFFLGILVCLAAFALALLPPSKVGRLAPVVRYSAAFFLIATGVLMGVRGSILGGLLVIAAGCFVLARNRLRGKQNGAAGNHTSGSMTLDEAYQALGLSRGAGEEEVRRAHRELMQKIHPDHGGTSYLAAKLNQARDLILKQSK